MRSSTITYESVCKQINELVTNGEKITVRNVRSHTGGQVSRVMEYVKRWREENNICNLIWWTHLSNHFIAFYRNNFLNFNYFFT